jgi:hypothetical protein
MSSATNAMQATIPVGPVEPVYVFGSNLAGSHDHDSAGVAARFHGAESGKWNGLVGNSYAIPYRNSDMQLLGKDVLRNYILGFNRFAQSRPDLHFQIGRFGCESGAYTDTDMAPMFRSTPPNCSLPGVWLRVLDVTHPARLIVYDPAARMREGKWHDEFVRFLNINQPLWNAPRVEIVSVGGARNVVANDAVAKKLKLKHRIIGPNPGYYGEQSEMACELKAIWYSTHLLCIADLDQTAQPTHIRLLTSATRGGLVVDQLDSNLIG